MTARLTAAASPLGAAAPAGRWTTDNPPPADGCHRCGLIAASHHQPHAYEPPTRAERAARIEARRQIAMRHLVPCEHCGGAGCIARRPGDRLAELRPTAQGSPCPHCVDGLIDPDLTEEEV